jgi:hypothetical protein
MRPPRPVPVTWRRSTWCSSASRRTSGDERIRSRRSSPPGRAALGAAAGGLLGALVDLGIPEEEAHGYEEHVRKGSILLTVNANSDEQARQAHQLFDRHGGSDVRAYGVAGAGRGAGRGDDQSAGDEAGAGIGGAAGAVGGGVVGAAIGGPVGAAVGAAAGGAVGAGAGHAAGEAAEDDRGKTSGAGGAGGSEAEDKVVRPDAGDTTRGGHGGDAAGATSGMGGAAGVTGGSIAPAGGAGTTGGTSGGGRRVITSDELRDDQAGRSPRS